MGNGIDRFAATLQAHLATTVLAALGALVVVCGVVWVVRSARRRGVTGEQAGTLVAAAIATGVSAQGMWVFFDKSLHLTLSLRIMFFAFLEIMVLTSALRARSAQQVSGSAGIDGVAMWVLTCLSAVLAATDADNLGTVLIRLSAPLVAAWGWERSMALERRRSGMGGINWRITPERMLIRLGFADPTDRTAGEAAQQRRLIDVALAADRARTLRDTGAGVRRVNRARRRLQKTMRRAVEDGGLVDNSRTPRAVLMDNLRVLSSTGALLELELPNPWTSDEELQGPPSQAPAATRATASAPDAHPAYATPSGAHAAQATLNSAAITADRSEQSWESPELQAMAPMAPASLPATMPLPILTAQASAAHEATSSVPEAASPAPATTAASAASSATPGPSMATHETSATPDSAPTTPPDHPTSPEPTPARLSEQDATETPSGDSTATQSGPPRQYRRDPAVRDRVRDMRAANISITDIAAELGTSTRTISRILGDLDAESPETQEIPARPPLRNPAQAAVSNWHNGFRVLPGGNAAAGSNGNTAAVPGSNGTAAATEERPDRSIEN
ncbi:hypothetical protein [Nocardia albiluteola]|uniref:hypothetical protein n=1 Tax=Nocardia albiluteola TaxID=2842303 RepID=UPI001FD9E060|nr:hypothetical protein [Nocardia albiluteola]